MATQLQFRRGTTAQNNSYTGLVGEISLDTSTNNIRIHDGSTAGGAEIIPAGTIVGYGAGSAPTGWLLCDDTAVSRTTYARLFAVIGTGYGGGDGSGTFNVPDLRDKVPLGKGANNDTLGTTTGSAAASSVLASTSKTGVTTAAANTGTANTGTGNTGTGTTGTGTSGNSTATTTAANTGTANTGTGNTGTGNTGADGDGDLTLTTYTVNQTLSAGTKDVTQVGLVTAVNQASHSHSIPALSVPALSVPALTIPSLTVNNHTHSVPGLSIPALSVPALSIPALTVPSLTVNAFSVNTTLPTEVVNYIIKI
jgi:microcystin-dependent protein|tara:strand:+ start:308 stop:1237 length:930 start_codon:yes stop_codon:yes gene_type:complete